MRSPSVTRRRLAVLAVLLPALILATAGVALARGGGGGDYGGGGSGGGGSGGGGGGGGGDASFLIDLLWLLLRYPKVGVPVLLIVVIFAVVGGKKGRGAYQGSVIRRGTEALVGSQREAALAAGDREGPDVRRGGVPGPREDGVHEGAGRLVRARPRPHAPVRLGRHPRALRPPDGGAGGARVPRPHGRPRDPRRRPGPGRHRGAVRRGDGGDPRDAHATTG